MVIWQDILPKLFLEYTLFSYKKLICKKLVLGRPNRYETFSTQATEVKKLIIFLFSFNNFEDTVTTVCLLEFGRVSSQ